MYLYCIFASTSICNLTNNHSAPQPVEHQEQTEESLYVRVVALLNVPKGPELKGRIGLLNAA